MKKCVLCKIRLLAAFEPNDLTHLTARTLAEAAAELLRHDGALTVASDAEVTAAAVPGADDGDSDVLIAALEQQYPDDGLFVGVLPPVHMLGRNGLFRRARLVRVPGRLQLWLGFDDERYPLLEFPDTLSKRV